MNESAKELRSFYARVDAAAARIADKHRARLTCRRGCASCCVDGITVFGVEAENIAALHHELLEKSDPHPAGMCAFLDAEGACRIYADRPYVCRTQGLPLRWIEEDFDETIEYRDICPLNAAGEPVEDLEAADCWTLGPFEEELSMIQAGTGDSARVPLRDLFTKKAADR